MSWLMVLSEIQSLDSRYQKRAELMKCCRELKEVMITMSELKLMEHQTRVLEETARHNRVAYYLDMGLGKTFVGSEKMDRLGEDINLIICQKSKIKDWCEHMRTYYDVIVLDLTHRADRSAEVSSGQVIRKAPSPARPPSPPRPPPRRGTPRTGRGGPSP